MLKNLYVHIYIYTQSADSPVRPLRSHQCSSEWFENWDMSTAQRAINTSHTDKQWHILHIYIYIYIYIVIRKNKQRDYIFVPTSLFRDELTLQGIY